jgi:hypothetical protein
MRLIGLVLAAGLVLAPLAAQAQPPKPAEAATLNRTSHMEGDHSWRSHVL